MATTTNNNPYGGFASEADYIAAMSAKYRQEQYQAESPFWHQVAADSIRVFELQKHPVHGPHAQQMMVQYFQPLFQEHTTNPHLAEASNIIRSQAHAPLTDVHVPAIQYKMNVAQDEYQKQQVVSPQPGKNNNWEEDSHRAREVSRQQAGQLLALMEKQKREHLAAMQAFDTEMEPATVPVEWTRPVMSMGPPHGPLGAVTTSSATIHPGMMRTRIFADIREKLINEDVYRPCNRWRTGDPTVD